MLSSLKFKVLYLRIVQQALYGNSLHLGCILVGQGLTNLIHRCIFSYYSYSPINNNTYIRYIGIKDQLSHKDKINNKNSEIIKNYNKSSNTLNSWENDEDI